jgi:hypothetical protein
MEVTMSFDSVLDKFYPILILLVIVLIVLIWQGLATFRAKANILREETYRILAEKVTATEEKSLETQQKTIEVLDDMRTRLVSIEKLLRDIE